MKTFECTCGARLFFENSQCLACGRDVGWCPICRAIRSLDVDADGGATRCGYCRAALIKCHNYAVENVCNRCVVSDVQGTAPGALCDYCRFNQTIPDLTVAENRQRWYRLEQGKRRLLYTLDLLGLPYGTASDGVHPPLSFDFKADASIVRQNWFSFGQHEQVHTGHLDGKITINLREAEPVEREKLRVAFDEAHRTIIGHFRHEISHYYWQMLVSGRCEDAFAAAFGDHRAISYENARQNYYQQGPAPDWRARFVSAYASMHPWEDFAETFATYLDVVSVLDTAGNMGLYAVDPRHAELDPMLERYEKLGVMFNEMNRAMGLTDLVPEVFSRPVAGKMKFVHDLIRAAVRTERQGGLFDDPM
ncbi:MAG: hypothetical protein GC162_03095 [Planctomycetes bacterium]|nr:hypothetical protein [Planctomycetota bacterium]